MEAAGTWFGALVSLGAVIIAARVFLSDKLYQHYQMTADEQERAERAEKDRALVNEARRIKFETGELPADGIPSNDWIEFRVVNNSYHTMSQVRVTHSSFPVDTRPTVFTNDEIHPGERLGLGIKCLEPVQTHTVEKLIFAEITVTFILNDRRLIKRGLNDPELAE